MSKKYKRAGTTSERQDYRQGGYVGDGKRVKKYLAGAITYPTSFNFGGGSLDFRSETLINNGDLNGPILTVSGTDPRNFLAIGDTIAVTTTADTSVAKSMGIIKSFDSSTQLTLESTFTTGDVVHEDIVYNVAPLTIRLHLER